MVNRDMEETNSKTFSVFLQNIRSLPRDFEEFELEIEQLAYHLDDIICLTETWLKNNSDNDNFQIQGYEPLYSCARIKRGGGGIGIYVNTGSDHRIIKQKKITISKSCQFS